MPDITMCKDNKCPKKETCYRFKAAPSHYQSYFLDTPREGKDCKLYIEVKENPKELYKP